jgi:hypothetical protein
MREKILSGGCVGYFWASPTYAVKRGFTIGSEPLGRDYAGRMRASELAQLASGFLAVWTGRRKDH